MMRDSSPRAIEARLKTGKSLIAETAESVDEKRSVQ